jgi:hypothetical protein
VTRFAWLADEAPVVGVFLAAHGLQQNAFATFEPMVPGAPGVEFLLKAGRFGISAERWFGRVVASHTRLERGYDRPGVRSSPFHGYSATVPRAARRSGRSGSSAGSASSAAGRRVCADGREQRRADRAEAIELGASLDARRER